MKCDVCHRPAGRKILCDPCHEAILRVMNVDVWLAKREEDKRRNAEQAKILQRFLRKTVSNAKRKLEKKEEVTTEGANS